MQSPAPFLASLCAAVSIGLAAPAADAEDPAASAPVAESAAPAAPAGDSIAPAADSFPPDQIEQMVAPIALYPDALIAQIMMASTYPLDVVQANRWLKDQEGLEGDALQKAVDEEEWDDSVKALAFFPSVLGFMSDNLDWTQDLGDAVLAQQGDVTDAIQRLRGEADQAGALATTEQQRVEKAGDTIIIQPAQPEVVYVPTYDPVKVYGQSDPPAKSYYPDAYAEATSSYEAGYAAGQASATFPSGQVVPSGTVVYPTTTEVVTASDSTNNSLLNFGLGAVAGGLLTAAIMWDDDDRYDRVYYGGRGYYGGPSYWGGANYWNNNGWREPRNINVDRTRNIDIDRNIERGDININKGIVGNDVKKWEHNPERRGGVRYRDSSTQKRFEAKRKDRTTINRDQARGRLRDGDGGKLAGAAAAGGGLSQRADGGKLAGLKDRGGERQLKAPDLGQVKREGAASGKLGELKDRGGAGAAATLGDRGGERQLKAPDLGQVKREGAASGKLGELKDRGGAGTAANLKDRAPGASGKVADLKGKAPDARAKVQAKAPAATAKAKAMPKPQAKAATKRPVNREAKRPAASQVKRPAKAAAAPKVNRPAPKAVSARAGGNAFSGSRAPKSARAASNRGGASRAKASHRGGGAKPGGGGGRRHR